MVVCVMDMVLSCTCSLSYGYVALSNCSSWGNTVGVAAIAVAIQLLRLPKYCGHNCSFCLQFKTVVMDKRIGLWFRVESKSLVDINYLPKELQEQVPNRHGYIWLKPSINLILYFPSIRITLETCPVLLIWFYCYNITLMILLC